MSNGEELEIVGLHNFPVENVVIKPKSPRHDIGHCIIYCILACVHL